MLLQSDKDFLCEGEVFLSELAQKSSMSRTVTFSLKQTPNVG